MHRRFYPTEQNLGKDCRFWPRADRLEKIRLGGFAIGCTIPKREMEGRLSCEGIIDDVCLFLKDGRRPPSLTEQQIIQIRLRIPGGNNRDLPPGDVR